MCFYCIHTLLDYAKLIAETIPHLPSDILYSEEFLARFLRYISNLSNAKLLPSSSYSSFVRQNE